MFYGHSFRHFANTANPVLVLSPQYSPHVLRPDLQQDIQAYSVGLLCCIRFLAKFLCFFFQARKR
jgi:hypothetical protein